MRMVMSAVKKGSTDDQAQQREEAGVLHPGLFALFLLEAPNLLPYALECQSLLDKTHGYVAVFP